jgi:hypothetical protein
MKHAGPAALAQLDAVLLVLRQLPMLVERTPGSFYCKSRGWLHFHEDAAGLFADFKRDGANFERFGVTSKSEQQRFLKIVNDTLRKIGAATPPMR